MTDRGTVQGKKPRGSGSSAQKLRLYSGLVLFAFAATHLVNHACGLISIELMEAVRMVRSGFWRSAPGTVLLYGSLIIHVVFALLKFLQRKSWRMTAWEAIQLAFGLAIPLLLLRHTLGTRMPHEVFGLDDNYNFLLWALWPDQALRQGILILLVWVHGCIGIHFWLRLRPWYRRVIWPLNGFAVLVPVLAFAGFAVGGREVRLQGSFSNPLTGDQLAVIYGAMDVAFWACIAVVGAAIVYRLVRTITDRFRPTVRVLYADGRTMVSEIGPTLLEISRSNGVPHASVCGGRARCSTCRVRILDGLEFLHDPGDAERIVLERVGAGPNVRLACQLVPSSDLSIATLLPARKVAVSDVGKHDKYLWGVEQTVAIMFADIRGFTALSESRLPYDVVFLLNQYLGQMSDAISDAGGYVDKFIGDGIMAIFGMEQGPQAGARNAMTAARSMGGVLSALNTSLAADLSAPLNIGIGIHTGPAILGRIGVVGETGATQRITALGDTVNTASRLESACKTLGCQLVISEQTALGSGLAVTGGRPDRIAVKGREEEVEILAFDKATDLSYGPPAEEGQIVAAGKPE